MSAPTLAPGTVRAAGGRWWRVARITALTDTVYRARPPAAVVLTAVQIFLYSRLWPALYAGVQTSAGLSVRQAVSYSTLAVLAGRVRWSAPYYTKDSVLNRVREGTIVYWYLRPVSPARYYLARTGGDMLYGGAWALLGVAVALAVGVLDPPRDPAVAALAGVSLLLGQVITYYLALTVDLLCFWIINNSSAVRIIGFVQALLSGAFVPLWYLPDWLRVAAGWLPFAATLNAPLSVYIGRIPLADAPLTLAVQVGWCVVLASLTRLLWLGAGRRITMQGG